MKKGKKWLRDELMKFRESTSGRYEDVISVSHVLRVIDQLDESEKVIIPQFVADWMFQAKKWGYSISDSMGHTTFYYGDTTQYHKAMYWAKKNQDIFARAWLDGYEVEKEPLYFISFPTPNSGHINMWRNTDTGSYYFAKSSNLTSQDGYKCAFTEKEIKEHDERFWPFAVPVMEDN